MKPKHLDYCTHIQFDEDKDILQRPLFDVNMRLFNSSSQYRQIISNICSYLKWCTRTEKEGYKLPHGYSGANAGIPFNIICVRIGEEMRIMINPVIRGWDRGDQIVTSNCGSLTLDEPIEIRRRREIDVEYFDEYGIACSMEHVGPTPGFTIQHEVDHNLGVLITDLEVR